MRFELKIAVALLFGMLVSAAHPGSASAEIETVDFGADYPTGSIVIANKERRLYYVAGDGKALRYPVAIGVEDEIWVGREVISNKRENPRWIEPDEDGEGDVIEGGAPNNPLGKRALYLGQTLWRIHGTIAPWSIGKSASNGCIRMHNADVIDLYERVAIGTEVFVVNKLSDRRPEKRGRKLSDD